MNRPSKNDDGDDHPGWNQSPPHLAADLTTRSDLDGIANSRTYHSHRLKDLDSESLELQNTQPVSTEEPGIATCRAEFDNSPCPEADQRLVQSSDAASDEGRCPSRVQAWNKTQTYWTKTIRTLTKYAKFIGPGAMVSVAYIDPGNYATDVSAGATYRFKLLFMVLLSNIFAVFLQALCIRLGSVTGMDLAQMIKAHTPRWLNLVLYFFAEAAIIATDIAEVIGTAIALNLLFKLPLVAGCAISILDVLVILFLYRPSGSVRGLRAFELFVMALVLGVVICFCFQLSLIRGTNVGEVFAGYLPSSALVQSQGLYQSCGILGATVMPHSLYLGSGIVQPRLREYDSKHGILDPAHDGDEAASASAEKYRPSLRAIKACMHYSTAELAISLLTFALFVNSAILIVSGAALYGTPAASATLFGIHALLSQQLAAAAGVVFALALLLSGTSAGIVCTIAGQMVSEGQLDWHVRPWVRRLVTRSLSITPSIIIAGAVGAQGLSAALEASQVALSIILPVVSAPLIYFTCRNRYMTVAGEGGGAGVGMRVHWAVAVLAVLVWGLIVVMNVAAIVLLGTGVGDGS